MYREIYRLIRSSSYFWWILLSIFFVFYLSIIYYNRSFVPEKNWFHPIEKYEHYSEIPYKISNLELELETLDPHNPNDKEFIESIHETIKIYQYLYNHQLRYEDIAQSNGITHWANDKIAYLIFMTNIILLLCIGLAVILSTTLNNYEYLIGVHKFIFSQTKKRSKIIVNRLLVFLIFTIISSIFLMLLILLLSTPYSLDYQYILIYGKEKITHISTTIYLVANILSFIYVLLFYSILFFNVSLLFRNIFVVIVIDGLFIILLQWLPLQSDNKLLNAFIQYPLYIYEIGITTTQFLISNIIKWVLLIFFTIFSFKHFEYKDLP